MKAMHLFLIIIIGIAVFLVTGGTPITAQKQKTTITPMVNMTVPFGPIPVASTDSINIAFEHEFTTPDNLILIPK